MARQPLSKYLPTRYGGGLVLTQREVDGDDPLAALDAQEIRGLSFVDVQLTNAQVLALFATPQNLVAAPGAGRAIVVDRIYAVSDSAGAAWTEVIGQDMVIEYADGTDIQILDNTGFVTTGDVQRRYWASAENAIAGVTPIANSAVRLFKTVGEFGGGAAANTLSIRVYYHIVDTAAFT